MPPPGPTPRACCRRRETRSCKFTAIFQSLHRVQRRVPRICPVTSGGHSFFEIDLLPIWAAVENTVSASTTTARISNSEDRNTSALLFAIPAQIIKTRRWVPRSIPAGARTEDLEKVLQPELDQSGSNRSSRNHSEGSCPESRAGIGKLRMIESVVEFGTKLQCGRFAQPPNLGLFC
jgi:hypothetical protein